MTMSLTTGIDAKLFDAANVSAEPRLHCHHASSPGSARNNTAPLTRCRIDTIAGTGWRICSRLRYFGRVGMCGGNRIGVFSSGPPHRPDAWGKSTSKVEPPRWLILAVIGASQKTHPAIAFFLRPLEFR